MRPGTPYPVATKVHKGMRKAQSGYPDAGPPSSSGTMDGHYLQALAQSQLGNRGHENGVMKRP